MPKFSATKLGTSYNNTNVTRHIVGHYTDDNTSGDIFLHASVDIKSDTLGGTTQKVSQIKFASAIDPYEQKKGEVNPGYVPVADEISCIDSEKDVSIRNIRVGGKASIVSTTAPTDLINRTEIEVGSSKVTFRTISNVDPTDPDNSGGGFTAYANAQDGSSVEGIKELETKNVDDPTTKFKIAHVYGTINELYLTKDVLGTPTIIGIFK